MVMLVTRRKVCVLLAAVAIGSLHRSFLCIDARVQPPRAQTPATLQELPQMPRASTLGTEWSSWAATGLLAAGAAALAWRSQARDDSSTTMYGGHDKRTFRGKLHAHTFGKFRLRKGKKRRIKAIKNGTFDASKVVQRGDMEKAMEWLKKKGMAKADKKAGNVAVEGCVASYVHFNNKTIAVLVEVNSETDFVAQNDIFKQFAADMAMQVAANEEVGFMTVDDVPAGIQEKEKALEMAKEDLEGKPDAVKEKIVAGRLRKKFEEKALMNQKWLKDDNITVQEAVKQIIAKLGENIVVRRFERLTLGQGLEKKDDDFAAGVDPRLAWVREKELAKWKTEGEAKEEKKEEPKKEEPKAEEREKAEEKKVVQVSAAQVKELRGRSGAGILDAKKALTECDGDMDKAMEWLKKKGMAKADKKAGNLSAEGVIASYVHFNNKFGVLAEVNSETDFVALNEIFKEFANDVAMQVGALPDVQFVSVEDVPAEVMAKEKELEMGKEDLDGKPDNIKEKIVAGRLRKKFEETALLSQKWIKDEDKTVQEVLKETGGERERERRLSHFSHARGG
ncbi:unnamed protein product [Durusdinium trenchii]|uniref:Elongation factor Ts, mitochondrial n=1 Tax=Durusdinium trenchii TaxID=1381693 RepID=A0ABP0MCH6_9DINO